MALNIILTWPAFPAGVPLTLAALRRAATVSLSGTVGNSDIAPGAITADLLTPGPYWFGVDAGATDDYAVAFSPAIPALVNGLVVAFVPATTNTGPATLNPNGLGAKPIKKHGGIRDVDDNDLRALSVNELRYNTASTGYWELMSVPGNAPKDYPMQPASAHMAGIAGLPSAPQAGDQAKFWRGDATWVDINAQIDARAVLAVGSTLELFKAQNFH